MPAISIIVPVYKVEAYLDRCIHSILSQTFYDFELILVDDESPDKCPQMCDAWAKTEKRIKVLHKRNGGLSSARNAGIREAKGNYICFVDSDDWLAQDAIEYLYLLIKKYDADFAMAENMRVSKEVELKVIEPSETLLSQHEFLRLLLKDGTQENVQYAWAKIYKINLFKKITYPEGFTLEDVPTIFEIAINSSKIVRSSKIVYFYFYNSESITGLPFSEKRFDLLAIWDIVVQKANEYKCDEWILQLAKQNRQRADLGLLCNFAMATLSREERIRFGPRIKKVSDDLKRNILSLLRANIPLSRKIIAVSFCFAPKLTTCVLGIKAATRRKRKG